MQLELQVSSRSTYFEPIDLLVNVTFRQCTYGEYYSAGSCIMCPQGSYSLEENLDLSVRECEACPDAAEECVGDDMKLKRGHWRISAGASSISACILPEAGCLGGWETGDASCAAGYEGPLCAVCSDGYFLSTSTYSCEACGDNQSGVNPFTVAALAVLVVAALSLAYYMRANDLTSVDEAITHVLVKARLMRGDSTGERLAAVHESRRKKRKLFFAKVKIYVTMYQIISSMSFVLDLEFPISFNRISSAFGVLAMNFSQEFGVSCSTAYDYYDVLVVSTLFPICASCVLWLVYLLHVYVVQPSVEEARVLTKSNYFYVFLFFTYLVFPGVSTVIFRSFSCDNVDPDDADSVEDNHYLRSDYSISCSSDRYVFGVTWAAAMLVVYPLGVPLLYLYLLYTARSAISQREVGGGDGVSSGTERDSTQSAGGERAALRKVLFPLTFLYEYYRPEYWYWEVVETVQRLLLTGIVHDSALPCALRLVLCLSCPY